MFFKLNLFSGTQGRLKGLMFFCKEETGNMAGRRCLSPERPSQGPAQSYNWPVWASYQGVCGVIRGDGSPWEDGEQTGESSEKGCLPFYYQHTQLIQQNCPPNVSACPSSFIAGFSALFPIKGMALMAFDPHWIDKSMEKLQKHSSINPFESQKKKKKAFYVNTQASTGLAGFLKNTRKKFCHDLAVRPPHPLYPPLPLPPAPVETESRCGWWKLFPTIQGVGWCWIWSHCPERPTEDWIESAIWVSSDAELLCEGSRVQ